VLGSVRSEGSGTTTTSYDYGSGAGYALGQAVGAISTQGSNTQTSSYIYAWFDAPVRQLSTVSGTGQQSAGTSTATFDAFGRTLSVSRTGGSTETTTTTYDAASQAIVTGSSLGAAYTDNRYRMNGAEMWHYSARFDPRGGDAGGGSYTAQGGETLTSIALTLWGDGSLWYKLAEANGLSSASAVAAGQQLKVPPGVWRNQYNASTFIPYNPGAGGAGGAGEASPLYPTVQPPAGNKCGVFGQILLAAIATAVTVIAPFGGGFVAGMANAALGSVVSQGVGLATGIQDKFSFKAVGMAVIGSAVGGGGSTGSIVQDFVGGAVSSAITQGIGVALGLQDKFSWVGVAAAAVGNAVGGHVDAALGKAAGTVGGQIATATASMLANAATRSVIEGSNFGDNVMAALPDVIGGIVGRALGGAIAGGSSGDNGDKTANKHSPVTQKNVTTGQAVAMAIRATSPDWGDAEYLNEDSAGTLKGFNFSEAGTGSPAIVEIKNDGSIVVTAVREHGFGWHIAEALGFHGNAPKPLTAGQRDLGNRAFASYSAASARQSNGVSWSYHEPSPLMQQWSRGNGSLLRRPADPLSFGALARDVSATWNHSLGFQIPRSFDTATERVTTATMLGPLAPVYMLTMQFRDSNNLIFNPSQFQADWGGWRDATVGDAVIVVSSLLTEGLSLRLRGGLAAAERGAVLRPTGKQYSVAFETKLDPAVWRRSDKVHFNRANAAFDDALRSDPAFAAQMDTLIPGVQNSVARAGGRQNPTGWTWHHGSEPGSMQLVPTAQHTDALFWDAFHPNGVGGYNTWAIPAGAPPRR
jgi:DNase/tRNase domain of colicin-like bacteriocin/LysM domain